MSKLRVVAVIDLVSDLYFFPTVREEALPRGLTDTKLGLLSPLKLAKASIARGIRTSFMRSFVVEDKLMPPVGKMSEAVIKTSSNVSRENSRRSFGVRSPLCALYISDPYL
jgi:hypothetical protein